MNRRRFAALLACLVAFLGLVNGAEAQPVNLFETAGSEDVAAARALNAPRTEAARERIVRLNPAALADADSTGARKTPGLRIELFPDTVATFRREATERAYGGGSIWTGARTDDRDAGTATLVVDDGAVTGQVDLGGRIFRIEPIRGALHRVSEIRRDRLRPVGPAVRPPLSDEPAERRKAPDAAKRAAGPTTIDVLFAYTNRSGAASANIRSEINMAISLTNQAYRASPVKMKVRLVGTIEVDYNEAPPSYMATLASLTGETGYGTTAKSRAAFAPTRKMRDDTGADLVVLIREGGEYCGLAWVNDKMTKRSADFGYAEVSRDCLDTYTAAHEMGHNMGLNHDRYVEGPAPASHINYGYVNVADRVMDIMAYDDRCVAAGVNCRGLNRFSNPRKRVKGDPFGIPKGKKGAADASKWLNEVRNDVADFRTSKSAKSAAADERAASASDDN